MYYGAPGFYYNVAYKKDGEETWTQVQVTDPKASMYQVENPGVGQLYHFYVKSVNSLGEGPEYTVFSNYSGKISKIFFQF